MDVDSSRSEVDPLEVKMSHSGSGRKPQSDKRVYNYTHFLLVFQGEQNQSVYVRSPNFRFCISCVIPELWRHVRLPLRGGVV